MSRARASWSPAVDLYGQTGHFDVIAITDHILMSRDLLRRAGRIASLGFKEFSVTRELFNDYLADIRTEAVRAHRLYDLLVIPGAEVTQNHLRSRKNAHVVALNTKEWISADQPAEDILKEIHRQQAVSIACHPHHRTTRRIEIGTCYPWEHPKRLYSWKTLERAAKNWEAIAHTLRANVDIALTLYRNGAWAA